jgi:hypothetical protein
VGDEDPSDGDFGGSLDVLGKPSAATVPAEGSLHHPATWLKDEAFRDVGPFEDFDGPLA